MIENILIAIGGIVIPLLLWIGVQTLWGQSFSDHISEEDVLAARSGCGGGGCGCGTICKVKKKKIRQNILKG